MEICYGIYSNIITNISYFDSKIILQWNLSNPTHQGTMEMWRIVQDVGILRVYLVNKTTLGP